MAYRQDYTHQCFRGKDFGLILTYDEATTSMTAAATATDGTTSYSATIVKDEGTKTWTITWTNAQTTLMTSDVYKYEITITVGININVIFYGKITPISWLE